MLYMHAYEKLYKITYRGTARILTTPKLYIVELRNKYLQIAEKQGYPVVIKLER